MRLVLLAVALLVAAGCTAPAADPPAPPTQEPEPFVPPAPDFDFSTVVDPDHPGHSLPELHTAGHGLTQVGHTSVQELLPLGVKGSITQVDVQGDLAVVSGLDGGLAFVVVDVSDPADPKAVGWYPSTANGWTARLSDDGQYVFYGCQSLGELGDPMGQVRGTCEDPEAVRAPNESYPGGVVAVDIRDPANPTFVDFLAVGGSHNLQYAAINGTDYVFTSSVAILRFDRETGALELVAEVDGVHDVTVARHPVSGAPLLFTGTGQLSIHDVSNPANPVLLFEGEGTEGWTGWHDQAIVPALLDGRWILLLAGETDRHTGDLTGEEGNQLPDTVYVVDITEPSQPALLGAWQPPYDPMLPWTGYQYSVHEMAATATGQVAIAWYHAGAWVIDVSTLTRQAQPVTLAAFQPHEPVSALPPSTFPLVPVPYTPFVWGVSWHRSGHLVVPDAHTGLYLLEPEWGLIPTLDGGQ